MKLTVVTGRFRDSPLVLFIYCRYTSFRPRVKRRCYCVVVWSRPRALYNVCFTNTGKLCDTQKQTTRQEAGWSAGTLRISCFSTKLTWIHPATMRMSNEIGSSVEFRPKGWPTLAGYLWWCPDALGSHPHTWR